MAKVELKIPDEFLLKLSALGTHTEEVCTKMLSAGGEVVLEQTKTSLEKVIGKSTKYPSRSGGELKDSLGLTPVKVDKSGNYNIKIGFREPRKNGESNAKIANILEYGKHGQPAKPFLKSAKRAARKKCIAVMEQTIEDEVNDL